MSDNAHLGKKEVELLDVIGVIEGTTKLPSQCILIRFGSLLLTFAYIFPTFQ